MLVNFISLLPTVSFSEYYLFFAKGYSQKFESIHSHNEMGMFSVLNSSGNPELSQTDDSVVFQDSKDLFDV